MRLRRWAWLTGLLVVGLLVLSFVLVVRPWYMQWGAPEQEVVLPLPGDRFIPTDAAIGGVRLNRRLCAPFSTPGSTRNSSK